MLGLDGVDLLGKFGEGFRSYEAEKENCDAGDDGRERLIGLIDIGC